MNIKTERGADKAKKKSVYALGAGRFRNLYIYCLKFWAFVAPGPWGRTIRYMNVPGIL
jgi:hypothetical protein